MEAIQNIQEQVILLREQVALLETMIRSLPDQIVESVLEHQMVAAPPVHPSTSQFNAENQSFLLDETLQKRQPNPNYDLPLEGQIQRLTAQLTAAYNRIAALEEQLLSQRLMH
jgi:hypothetical protein